MAKGEKQPTGLEVLAEHHSQLPAWATAVAMQTIDHSYRAMINITNPPGKAKILEKANPAKEADPVYYAALVNQIALHLSSMKTVDYSEQTAIVADDAKQNSQSTEDLKEADPGSA